MTTRATTTDDDRKQSAIILTVMVIIAFFWYGIWYSQNHYSESFDNSFISSCTTTSNGQGTACSCILTQIKAHYSYQQARPLFEQIEAGNIPQEVDNLISACTATGYQQE